MSSSFSCSCINVFYVCVQEIDALVSQTEAMFFEKTDPVRRYSFAVFCVLCNCNFECKKCLTVFTQPDEVTDGLLN